MDEWLHSHPGGMEDQISGRRKVYADSGKIYLIRESGGTFYVSTTSWFPGGESIGSADSFDDAVALIVADPDSGGGIDSIE